MLPQNSFKLDTMDLLAVPNLTKSGGWIWLWWSFCAGTKALKRTKRETAACFRDITSINQLMRWLGTMPASLNEFKAFFGGHLTIQPLWPCHPSNQGTKKAVKMTRRCAKVTLYHGCFKMKGVVGHWRSQVMQIFLRQRSNNFEWEGSGAVQSDSTAWGKGKLLVIRANPSSQSIAKQPQCHYRWLSKICIWFLKRKYSSFNNSTSNGRQKVLRAYRWPQTSLFVEYILMLTFLQSTSKVFVTTESVELSRVQRLLSSLINLLQGWADALDNQLSHLFSGSF